MVAASLQYRCIIVAESPHRKYYLKSNASYGYSNVTFSLHFCNDNPPNEPPRRQGTPIPPTFRANPAAPLAVVRLRFGTDTLRQNQPRKATRFKRDSQPRPRHHFRLASSGAPLTSQTPFSRIPTSIEVLALGRITVLAVPVGFSTVGIEILQLG